jgi:hypothetical protein
MLRTTILSSLPTDNNQTLSRSSSSDFVIIDRPSAPDLDQQDIKDLTPQQRHELHAAAVTTEVVADEFEFTAAAHYVADQIEAVGTSVVSWSFKMFARAEDRANNLSLAAMADLASEVARNTRNKAEHAAEFAAKVFETAKDIASDARQIAAATADHEANAAGGVSPHSSKRAAPAP